MLYKLYIERIKSRLVDLKTKIDLKQIELNNDKSLKKYLFSFPSDFGGIGDILNGNQYENVNIFINITLFPYKTHKFFVFKLNNAFIYVPSRCGSLNQTTMKGEQSLFLNTNKADSFITLTKIFLMKCRLTTFHNMSTIIITFPECQMRQSWI